MEYIAEGRQVMPHVFPVFTVNEFGPCIVIGGAEVPLPDLTGMEGVVSTPSTNGGSEVILKCNYGRGRSRAFRVHMPRPVHELHQTTSTMEGGRAVTRLSKALLPTLSRQEFELRFRAMQKGEWNERL